MKILVVADRIDDELRAALEPDGHVLLWASDAVDVEDKLDAAPLRELIVLLPPVGAADLCRRLRADGVQIPILVIANEGAIGDRVSSLDSGADDVLARPFAGAELRARVRALGRRGRMQRRNEAIYGNARLDYSARRAWVDEQEVLLTPGEWSIMDVLERNAGRVASYEDILDSITGRASLSGRSSLEVLIGRIRKKLGSSLIRTVRGRGYSMG